MIKVSIIIPVYNTEKYLHRCMDSVIGQTLCDIEIICVDDGSTDGSLHVLKQYAINDSRIKVIHKENGGASSARKLGEDIAQGQYIGYVDSDDWIEPDMYENLYEAACVDNADMVSSGYFFEGNYISEIYDSIEPGVYKEQQIQHLRNAAIYYMPKKEKGLRGSLCCKLLARKLLQKIQCRIPERIVVGEDELFMLSCILECHCVVVLKKAYYHYIINPLSTMHVANIDYLLSVNDTYQYLLRLHKHPNFTKKMCIQSELYIMELLLKGMNSLMGFQTRNLLWFDPYWLDRIPVDSKVVLYGAGEAGRKCWQQLLSRDALDFVGCVDFGYEHFQDGDLKVETPEVLKKWDYDYVVITIKNPNKAEQVRRQLEELEIVPEKILWFEQREIFWRFAEAEGLLKDSEGMV